MSIKDLSEMIDIAFGISLTLGCILWFCLYLKLEKIYDELKEIRKESKNKKCFDIPKEVADVEIDNAINNIKADLDEAEEFALEYSSDLIQAFQQGRIYADRFALIQIERLICERRESE